MKNEVSFYTKQYHEKQLTNIFHTAPESEDEYEAPPGTAQGSSGSQSAPRSPLPESSQRGIESESGGSADSIAVEQGSVATGSIDGGKVSLFVFKIKHKLIFCSFVMFSHVKTSLNTMLSLT